jgi:hypothetical protein
MNMVVGMKINMGVVVFNYFYLSLVMKIYVGDEDDFGEALNDEKF